MKNFTPVVCITRYGTLGVGRHCFVNADSINEDSNGVLSADVYNNDIGLSYLGHLQLSYFDELALE